MVQFSSPHIQPFVARSTARAPNHSRSTYHIGHSNGPHWRLTGDRGLNLGDACIHFCLCALCFSYSRNSSRPWISTNPIHVGKLGGCSSNPLSDENRRHLSEWGGGGGIHEAPGRLENYIIRGMNRYTKYTYCDLCLGAPFHNSDCQIWSHFDNDGYMEPWPDRLCIPFMSGGRGGHVRCDENDFTVLIVVVCWETPLPKQTDKWRPLSHELLIKNNINGRGAANSDVCTQTVITFPFPRVFRSKIQWRLLTAPVIVTRASWNKNQSCLYNTMPTYTLEKAYRGRTCYNPPVLFLRFFSAQTRSINIFFSSYFLLVCTAVIKPERALSPRHRAWRMRAFLWSGVLGIPLFANIILFF